MSNSFKGLIMSAMVGVALMVPSAFAAEPTELKIGNFLDLVSWDTSNTDIGFNGPYHSAVYDPLIYLEADGTISPALATDWTYSDDLLTIRMNLRSDVVFSDGEPFDANAAVVNLEYLKAGTNSGEAYGNVEAFNIVDGDTIEIVFSQRDDSLLYNMALARSYMASPVAIANGTLIDAPVGSGPYLFDSEKSVPGAEYHFTKIEDHWDSDTYPFETVSVYPVLDDTARQNAMLAGQINVNYGDAVDRDQAMMQGWNIAEVPSGWVGLQFVDRKGEVLEPLGNVKVRQALNYAFDGAAILNAIGGGAGVVTNQIFPANGEIHNPDLDGVYAYNLDKARELLAEAGYPDGFAVTMPMSPIFAAWQPIVQQTFDEVGIDVTWDDMQMPDYQINAPSYPMFISRLSADLSPAATLHRMVTNAQWYNPTPGYEAYPELVELIETVHATRGDEQIAAYKAVNEKLTELAWWSIWYQPNNLYYSLPEIEVTGVTGYMFQPLRFIQLK